MFQAFFCFFIFIAGFAYAENELPLSNSDGGLNTLIHNAVSVISGDYMESANDMSLAGPEALYIERYYVQNCHEKTKLPSGHICKGWNLKQKSKVCRHLNNSLAFNYTEKSGRKIPFKGKKLNREHREFKFNDEAVTGYTNTSSGIIGACTHVKNMTGLLNKKKRTILLKSGFGDERLFKSKNGSKFKYKLDYEKKPTGHMQKYHYGKHGKIEEIEGINKAGAVFGSVKFFYKTKEKFKAKPTLKVLGSDGSYVFYKFKLYHDGPDNVYRLSKVVSDSAPTISYKYGLKDVDGDFTEQDKNLKKRMLPNGRFLHIHYYKHGNGIKKDDFRVDRVKSLNAPAGHGGKSVPIYSFEYVARVNDDYKVFEGRTRVFDGNNHLIQYGYTKEHRLDRIEKFSGNKEKNYALYSSEKYSWNEEGNLVKRALRDKSGTVLAARIFDYDKYGNIIKDTFTGNLRNYFNLPTAWTVQYRYSDDGYNLLLEENEPTGKSTHYAYDEETKVLKSKFVLEHGIIRLREFYDYDENALVICQLLDDGTSVKRDDLTSVTMRKITRTFRSETLPLGMPIQIDENYYDLASGQELLLKRKFNQFDRKGRLTSSHFHDSQGSYLYSQHFEYNHLGNVVLETNGAGDTIERKFNENGDLIFERGFTKTTHKELSYDLMGRLVEVKEIHEDGSVFTLCNSYDPMGNLTETVDPFGRKTTYVYDEFNRVIQTHSPSYYDAEGNLTTPSTFNEYDIFGNIISTTDATGRTTKKNYNIRGCPTQIYHHDGSIEEFIYNDNGSLSRSTDKNGSYTLYNYDCFQRIVKKEHFSKSGEPLSSTTTFYNSFHTLAEIDSEGTETKHHYDSRGLLTSTLKGNSLKEFEYDECLRLKVAKEWTSDTEYLCTIFSYDILSQVIEEKIVDSNGILQSHKQFIYDKSGNKIQVLEQGKNGPLVTKTKFDSHNKIVKITDPEGHETHMNYHYYAYNKHGQMILECVEINPVGVSTITQFSIYDKPELMIKKNAFGEILSEKELFYDILGNLYLTNEKVISNGEILNEVKTKWEYDRRGLLVKLVEAFGDMDQKITEYKYNALSEKTEIIKPDGTIIHHVYDMTGRLIRFYASDDSFSYHYEYDKKDHLIKSYDELLGQYTLRDYDAEGRLSSETLGSGLKVGYRYDRIGRPVSMVLPDDSGVSYLYEGQRLKKVKRFSKNKEFLYCHEYLEHDLQGHVLNEKQIFSGGEVAYVYDNLSRLTTIKSENFSESVSFDLAGNLIKQERNDFLNRSQSHYTYDDLNQISSETGVKTHHYQNDSLNNCIRPCCIIALQ